MFKKIVRQPKKTLDDLLSSKEIITGKEVIHNLKEQEKRQKEFEESVEVELRNRNRRGR
jgi:hypothetical protein